MIIYLIRHGQTRWNIDGRIQGNVNTELEPSGLEQAELAGKKLANLRIDRIYSSDLKRALVTAEIINKYLKSELVTDTRLRELNYGEWEGKQWPEIQAGYGSYIPKWQKDRLNVPAPGGESLRDLEKRLTAMVEKITGANLQTVMVVSHGGTLKALTCLLLNLGVENHYKFVFGNTSITTIQYNPSDQKGKLICLNDTSHLGVMPFQSF